MKWERLAVENDPGNSATNILWLENRIVYSNAVDVAEGATLAIVSRNSYSQWASDFSGVRGTFALYDHGGAGGFVDEGTTGFPNAKVKFLDSTGTFQLRFKRDANGVIEIGELSTDDAIAAPAPNAIIYNIVNYTTQTLKIGGLGTDSTFYGNISNGAACPHARPDRRRRRPARTPPPHERAARQLPAAPRRLHVPSGRGSRK